MGWNYSGDPASCPRDEVRYLCGDTCKEDPLVDDEEILYHLSNQPDPRLAAALVLRTLATKYSRLTSVSVGDVSYSGSDLAKAFVERANDLDPSGITTTGLCLPVFGGISRTANDALDNNPDAVPPAFRRGIFDLPGTADDAESEDPWIR